MLQRFTDTRCCLLCVIIVRESEKYVNQNFVFTFLLRFEVSLPPVLPPSTQTTDVYKRQVLYIASVYHLYSADLAGSAQLDVWSVDDYG